MVMMRAGTCVEHVLSQPAEDDGAFVVRIDEPPAKPAPVHIEPAQRPPLLRLRHALRIAVGKRLQFAPEFGPRGVLGAASVRVVRCGAPPLRGEWWATDQFQVVAEAYRHNFGHGRIRDGRSQLCMYRRGKKVVDAWGDSLGADESYSGDSLQAVFSCSKVMCAIVFGWLRDRGHIDYDAKVCTYWREFAAGGKEDITVQDLLKHDGGIPWLDDKVPSELTVGTERLDELAALLAAQTRIFPPGKRVYHAVIQGPLLNELCRRADPRRRTIAQVLSDEIAQPLGIDVYLSLRDDQDGRLATSYTPSDLWAKYNLLAPYAATKCFLGTDQAGAGLSEMIANQSDLDSLYNKASRPVARDEDASSDEQRRRFINTPALCASNGMANARGLAKLGAMIVNGGEVDGVRILRRSTVREMCSTLDVRPDAFFGNADMGWTRGGFYRWDHTAKVYAIREGAIGWAGLGGSCLILDMEKGLATAFCTTSMRHAATTELRWAPFFRAAYEAIATAEQPSHWRALAIAARVFVRHGPQYDKRLQALPVHIE